MAGDWLPIRHDLPEDPAVIAIAEATGLSEDDVVGKLLRVWRWFDCHTIDGNAPSVTDVWLDRHLGAPGFAAAMIEQDWLEATATGLRVPEFDKFISQSAKQRALTAKRAAAHRSRKRNAGRVTESAPTEQNRTEEVNTPLTPLRDDQQQHQPPANRSRKTGGERPEGEKPEGKDDWQRPLRPPTHHFDPRMLPLPEDLEASPAFKKAWADWLAYLMRKTSRLDQDTLTRQLVQFARAGPDQAAAAIDKAITAGWLRPALEGESKGTRPQVHIPRITEDDARR